jgi:serine O-acetyltransferase
MECSTPSEPTWPSSGNGIPQPAAPWRFSSATRAFTPGVASSQPLHLAPGVPLLPRLLSQLSRQLTGVEIHPGARIGRSVFIDHGMGVVIGETSVVGDKCLLYQGVTLGGTGKEHGKRHPTLKENVVVGAGAKVLGAITVGANTRIGAGSVVLRNVAPDSTVVGIPGRVIHQSGVRVDPLAHSALPDAEANVIRNLMERIDHLESELSQLQDCLREVAAGRPLKDPCRGNAQNLKDREILEFLGEATLPRRIQSSEGKFASKSDKRPGADEGRIRRL